MCLLPPSSSLLQYLCNMYNRPAALAPEEVLLQRGIEFARKAWWVGLRADQRAAQQLREIRFEFPQLSRDVVEVFCGETVVVAKALCELVEPSPLRPKHGFLTFQCRQLFTARDGAAKPKELRRLGGFLERLFRDHVVETEGLCVLPGRRVWSVQVSVTVVNDDGNVRDAAQWATMAVLRHLRRPELTIRGDQIVVHPPHERDPVPLALHYCPVSCSFAVPPPAPAALPTGAAAAGAGPLRMLVDPTATETAAAACVVVTAINAEGMVCALERTEGCDVPWETVQECIAVATTLTPAIAALMEEAMREHEARRKETLRSQFLWAQKRLGVGRKDDGEPKATDDNAPAKAMKTES
ncbi:exosome complex component RRP45 [Strigomonas culicis]|uniref:Exosome complex component RRP45 n=1 Tax=Strigomonas culicis TaxID=28005 RepID=S9UZF2_9TRYP|nr:exosome complex component RRP45 [Strigomonas culicis]|eukprot:EPY34168.1 exosome complex component RRP45 [Strigomonas culicis]